MATTQRLIIEEDLGLRNGPLTFTRLSDLPTLPVIDYRVVSTLEETRRSPLLGPRFRIFRAQLQPSNSEQIIDAFLKVDVDNQNFDSLSHEARLYESNDLKGIVPNFYGLFQTEIIVDRRINRKRPIYCLVLEYSGEAMPVQMTFDEMELPTLWEMFLQLIKFHDAGYEHGNFFGHNLLFRPGSLVPTIIDLENAKKHTCSRDKEFGICLNDVAPQYWHEYGCKEIYEFAVDSGIWNKSYIRFNQRVVLVSAIKSAEQLVSLVIEYWQMDDYDDLLAGAQEALDNLIAREHPDYCPDPDWRP